MFTAISAFSGFSVDDLAKAKTFYTETLGLKIIGERMDLQFQLPNGGQVFVYPKENHEPAAFTILNFVVGNIDQAVDELTNSGVAFEQYNNLPGQQDEKGIARGIAAGQGPDIAWFKDPAGNILAVLQNA